MKLLVVRSAAGHGSAVPLQMHQHRNVGVFIEFAQNLKGILEKSGLVARD
jgi:hypothetical protein